MTEDTSDLGAVLRTAREGAGWSLSRMAAATGFSKPYLSKLETGHKPVKPWHITAYDKSLGGDAVHRRARLKMGAGFVAQTVWADLENLTASPSRVETRDVVALEASVDVLTGLGLRHGGRAASAPAQGQLKYSAALLSLEMSEETRGSLLMTVGRLADRTAWAMADSGQLERAAKIYDFALSVTPDPAQRWLSLVNLSGLRLRQAMPGRALELLDGAEPGEPVLRFLVDSTRAHAHAQLGDYSKTLRHIGRADEAHADVDLADLPAAIRPYTSGHAAHADSAGGKALYALTRSGRRKTLPLAVARLEAAVGTFGLERTRAIENCRKRLQILAG